MKIIEQLLQQWKDAQPLEAKKQKRMDEAFMIDFNYNSNHLEGNTLTYGQTRLLLLFGKVKGEALMRDYEEVKAHNVGFEMMKEEALDKQKPLTESFLRLLNKTILAGDYFKVSKDGSYRYKIHTGVYKTRPNSVITPSGVMFDYASPEETSSLMGDLVKWYNEEEQKKELSVIELAALFHYRYIRIHPFEDGNGRIARLVVNYILLRNGYPMIIIPNADRKKYLNVLGKCDEIVGKIPYDGANADIERIQPFYKYIEKIVEHKLITSNKFINNEIKDISETNINEILEDKNENVSINVSINNNEDVSIKEKIIDFILQLPNIKVAELADILSVTERTVYRNIDELKNENRLLRIGSRKKGYWKVNN